MTAAPQRSTSTGRPLRVRLTAAFASVVALVLAATGVLVYVEFARDLDRHTSDELAGRQRAIVGLAADGRSPQRVIDGSGEVLAQVYDARGAVIASARRMAGARLLTVAEATRARRVPVVVSRAVVPGSDDGARVRAFALPADRVAAIGEPLDDRERELAGLAVLLALTLPAALLLASAAGYQVARAALSPVEEMRAYAARIGEGDLSQRLPEPGTRDELDRLAATLNDLLDRLATAVVRERRIVDDASHELRTPIAVLRTRLDVALRGDRSQTRLVGALEASRHDVERLSRLADDLLVLARADQGRLPLRREPLDVQDLLEEAARRGAEAAAAAGRALVVRNRIDGGAVVLGDADRIAQAFDNLVANALRHGDGDLDLSAEADGASMVALGVRDHGAGFPEPFLGRAFERFSQADAAHHTGGSGLGLAIVDAVARSHGGAARAANAAGGGAVVTFTVPLA